MFRTSQAVLQGFILKKKSSVRYLVLESICDEDIKGSRLRCDPIPGRLGGDFTLMAYPT